MSKPHIIQIQNGLAGLGYQPGAADGIAGPRTLAAAAAALANDLRPAAAAIKPETTSIIYQGSARYPVAEIAVHCSATVPDWMRDAGLAAQKAEIRRWHLANGWRAEGYHWFVGREGDVLSGRAETEIGAGIEGHNRGVIHICLIGGHGSSETDPFSRNFTQRQDAALRQLIQGIGMRTRITRISGHNEYAAKSCPGFQVGAWLKEAA
ncbi:N-acetylmuramoyl-L-alanine amidase [Gemmobacter serpentinus]|uniref:N-acetylmuramoyl-L-alanine amidase n=1 Tax=Gemmobacter serpentinus TaxID=2652247 RepID=UPI00124DB8D7|nr:N-acetylmuramoyl-L-alanine amidase [Gemmobacter serpentinus]